MSDVTVKFSAEDQNLSKTVSNIQKDLNRLDAKSKDASKGFDLSFGKIGLAAGVAGAAVKAGMMAVEGATAAARAVVDGFGDAINLGGRLNDLSSRTGETAGNILLLERAFQNAGVGAEKVGGTVNKLQKFMAEAAAGGAEQTATLDALGISMADLAGKTPTEQMQVFAKRIAGVTDPAERARAAMTIFGKSGGELLPLLNNFSGELTEAQRQLGGLPGVMDRSNVAFDSLGDQLGAMKTKAMEFAAGFIEDALPALNIFTKSLSGVDAAGWGQALMKQVMSVADFLIGAFKAPMPAIEAIGTMLMAGVKIGGNALLNSFITAGEFLFKYIGSDIPTTAIKTIGAAMGYVYTSFAKGLLDAIIYSAKYIEEFFSQAVDSVVRFFTTGFSNFVSAFAQDFKNAMSDPIGFVTGKFKSGLDLITQGGAGTFKSAFDGASGSVLEKISAGLGATADGYKEKLVEGTASIKDNFGKLISSIEPSAKDFFGAKSASEEAATKFKAVESVGTKLREDFEKSATAADGAQKKVNSAVGDAEAIAGSFNKAEASSKKIKEELSESAKLMKSIADAEAKNAVDQGGRLGKRAQDQIARGDFEGARRTASKIAENEAQNALTGTGANRDRRNIADIGKDYGLSRGLGESSSGFRERIRAAREDGVYNDFSKLDKPSGLDAMKSKGSLKDELAAKKAGVDKPGQDGQKPPAKDDTGGKKGLDGLVEKILELVQKIEPRLPVAALSA